MTSAQDANAKDWDVYEWHKPRLDFGLVLGSRGHYIACPSQSSPCSNVLHNTKIGKEHHYTF